jgi:alpha-glucuronidase
MAENKKGFILYSDIQSMIDKLPDEYAGKLFKHLLAYVNDEEPTTDDIILQIAFEPIKQSLKRDLNKWNDKINKRSEAGKIGANVRWQKQTIANDSKRIKPIAKIADSVNVNVNDNVLHIYREFNHLSLSIEDFNKLRTEYSKQQINDVLIV